MLLPFLSKLCNLERYFVNFYYVLSRYNFRIFFRDFPNYSRAKESQNRVEFFVFFQVKLPDKRDKMTSRFQNSTPKFKIKDENFNDCVSISTNSSISSIKSYRASIKGWKILKTNCGFLKSSKEWPYFFAYVFLP